MKTILTEIAVHTIFMSCLFKNVELDLALQPITKNFIEVEGVVIKTKFCSERIEKFRDQIITFLKELHPMFFSKTGWSFLNMAYDKNTMPWTDYHRSCDELVCLGIAIGKVKFEVPRQFWSVFPGGVPNIIIEE
jgi:hypothetical protein